MATALVGVVFCTPAHAVTRYAAATFGYTGGEQKFVVPAGVTSVTVYASGAWGGGYEFGRSAGAPDESIATVAVTPGEVLYVEVGGEGENPNARQVTNALGHATYIAEGGFNGGGPSGGPETTTTGESGGGGGGASDVRTVTRTQGNASLASRLVVGPGAGGDGGRPGPGGSVALVGSGGNADAFGTDGKGESGYPLGGDGGAFAQRGAGGAGGEGGGHGQPAGYFPGIAGGAGVAGAGGAGEGPDQLSDSIGNPPRQATYAGGGGGGGGGGWYGGGGGGGGGVFDSNLASPPQFPAFMEAGAGGGGGGGEGYSASGEFTIVTVPFSRGPDGSVVLTYNQITLSQPTVAPGGNGAAVTIGCAGAPCTISMELSVTESISRGQVVAIGARVVRRTVVIGKARVTLRPGSRKRVSVTLNRSGRNLEATHKHLRARLRILQLATGAKPVLLSNALLKLK